MKNLIKITILSFLFINNTCSAEYLRIAGSKSISILPIIASKNGIFKKNQLDVKLRFVSTGKNAMDAVLSNSADIGIVVDSNISYLAFRKPQIVAIGTILEHTLDGIVSCGKIEAFTKEGIKNKRIGYLPGTTSELFLLRLLKKLKLNFLDIKPIILQPATMKTAIENNSVDAVSIWNPWKHNILKNNSHCNEYINDKELYNTYVYLVIKKANLPKLTPKIYKFLKSLKETEKYITQKSSFNKYVDFTNLDINSAKSVWDNIKVKLGFSRKSISTINENCKLLKNKDGSLRDFVNANNLVNFGLVRKVSAKIKDEN